MDGYRFAGRDGVELACREAGSGRPLILLHGFMGAGSHMLDGWAGPLAGQGRRVVLPDFRGHGDSAKPHDPAAYPPDVLADDGLALVEHLGFGDGVAIEPGSRDALIAQWTSQLSADPRALLHVLDSLVPTPEGALRQITIPALVAIGDRDERSDAGELAALLRDARFVRVPGGSRERVCRA
jgi:pimeloyl-ACP methyl ester carboxylesterase